MVNLILKNKLKEYLIKLVKLLVFFASSEILYCDHLFYKSVNLLLDLTWITVIVSMIKLQHKNWKYCSLLPSLSQLFNCTKYFFQWNRHCWQIHYWSRWIIQTLIYRNPTFLVDDNKLILDASIKYALETKRFDEPIF